MSNTHSLPIFNCFTLDHLATDEQNFVTFHPIRFQALQNRPKFVCQHGGFYRDSHILYIAIPHLFHIHTYTHTHLHTHSYMHTTELCTHSPDTDNMDDKRAMVNKTIEYSIAYNFLVLYVVKYTHTQLNVSIYVRTAEHAMHGYI